MTAPGGQGDVPVWCSEHMEPYCPRHSAEFDAPYRALLGLMLENVHISVSNEDIVVDTEMFPAPTHLRAALATLMEEWVDGEATRPIPSEGSES